MKTKLTHLFLATLAILTLGISGATAGVLGKYNVKGKENQYSFKGTMNLSSFSACTVRLKYNDGDSVSVKGKLKTPLKETKNKQTAKVVWSVYGMTGSGTVTIQGINGGYSTSFTYSGYGISGRGTGTKKP